MIPFLIYMLIKKHGKQICLNMVVHFRHMAAVKIHFVVVMVIIFLLALMPLLSKSQSLQLKYKVSQGSNDIGWLTIERQTIGNRLTLVLLSEIKIRFVFMINVFTKECSTFDNGKLQNSSVYRKANGTLKVDKQTSLNGGQYEVSEDGGKSVLPITYIGKNLLSLYFQEPIGISQVYCDKHECFIALTKIGDGAYKLLFPDGSSNCYYYQGGICTKLKVSHNFYSANLNLIP